MTKLHCASPCPDCPFRKDSLKNWLNHSAKIILEANSFVCHKTSDKKVKLQCAGHLNIKKFENLYYNFYRYVQGKELEIKNKDLLFDTEIDFLNHHIKSPDEKLSK